MTYKIYQGNCTDVLNHFHDDFFDMILTSPPYDSLRSYGTDVISADGMYDFKKLVQEMHRVLKPGGCIAWQYGDQRKDGDYSGTAFRQVIFFQNNGFNFYEHIIYQKMGGILPHDAYYINDLEHVFIFTKGKLKTFNPISDKKNVRQGSSRTMHKRDPKKADKLEYGKSNTVKPFSRRGRVWQYNTGLHHTTSDKIAYEHGAVMHEGLVGDLIKSFSNESDKILDPFSGSGTTCKMAVKLGRHGTGIEINPEFVRLSHRRLQPYNNQKLF